MHSGIARSGGLREALKLVAVCLKQGNVAFALGGSYAAWARGGPEPDHDVDFVIAASDVELAEALLAEKGLRVEQPPEDWLFKAYVDDAMVDVIHHIGGEPVPAELLSDAEEIEVLSVRMPVLSATDLVKYKLRALSEHECNFSRLLPIVRALREQIDWAEVRDWVQDNDYAVAFLFLIGRLGVADREVVAQGSAPTAG